MITVGTQPRLPGPRFLRSWLLDWTSAERGAAMRIAFGLFLLFDLLVYYRPHLDLLYGPSGFGARPVVDPLFDQWTTRWSLLRVLPEARGYQALFAVWVAAAGALIVGVRPRSAAIVAWACAVSFTAANPLIHNGGDRLKMFFPLMLAFVPCGERWSVAGRKHPTGMPVRIPAWPFRLIMLQMCIMYFLTGYWKLSGHEWQDGTVMFYVVSDPAWARWSPDQVPLLGSSWVSKLLSWGTIVWEFGFPIWVIWRPTRTACLLVGFLFHVLCFLHLEVGMFAIYSLCFYVPLFPWERWTNGKAASSSGPCPP